MSSETSWSLAMQQTLLFFLIMARWLLPKGSWTHQNLPILLLAHIGMAADILQFLSQGVETNEIACSTTVILIILGLWSWSLLQFTLPVEFNVSFDRSGLDLEKRHQKPFDINFKLWSILSILIMQDGPFLMARLYLVIVYNILDQSLLFFTAKNILIVLLQLYYICLVSYLRWEVRKAKTGYQLSHGTGQGQLASEPNGPYASQSAESHTNARVNPHGRRVKSNKKRSRPRQVNNGYIPDSGLKHSRQNHHEQRSPNHTTITVEAEVEKQPSSKSGDQVIVDDVESSC